MTLSENPTVELTSKNDKISRYTSNYQVFKQHKHPFFVLAFYLKIEV